MESTLLGSFLNLFIDPVVASCLIGLIGFTSYVVVNKRLNQILDLDDLELASKENAYDGFTVIFFFLGWMYGLVMIATVTLSFGKGQLFFYTWVESSDDLVSSILLLATLLFAVGFAFCFLNTLKITRLKSNARASILRGLGSAQTETVHPPAEIALQEGTSEQESLEERSEPVTFNEILDALDKQLKEAIGEAYELREELKETKSKVVMLEEEVQEKDTLIEEIESSKSSLSQQLSDREHEERDGKKLSLTDSVMVGDSIMGGMKIDKQVNNDPDAIARAVIAAYRAGRDDQE